MSKFFSKKKAAGAVAVVAVVAMLLTGTFAYVLNNQHRDDYLNTENRIYDLTLLNNFTSYDKTSWNQNENVANPILVKSMPNTADETYTNAYVAVQLMEYINVYNRGDWLTVGDVKSISDTTQALFAIDANGDYMTYAAATAKFGTTNIVSYTQDGRTYALINGSQKAADKNAAMGINGKPMRNEKDTFTYGDKTGYDDVKANGASPVPNDRCDSDPIQGWEAVAGKDARDYVSFELDSNVMTLSDWQAKYAADANDPALTGDFWIIGDNGWAYYAKPLAPNAKTADLLKNLKLEKSVSTIDYYMHVDMASASIDQIDILKGAKSAQGANMPANLVKFFKVQAGYNARRLMLEEALPGLITDGTAEAASKVEDINGLPVITDGSGNVYIIPENIPDSGFLNVIKRDPAVVDGKVDPDDIISLAINAINGDIVSDLTGIEAFPNLESVAAQYQPNLTSVDLSHNPNLKSIGFTGSENLESVNVTGLVNLESVVLTDTKVKFIDLSKCNKLITFSNILQSEPCEVIWPTTLTNRITVSVSYIETLNGLDFNSVRAINVSKDRTLGRTGFIKAAADVNTIISMDTNKIITMEILSPSTGFTVATFPSGNAITVYGTSGCTPSSATSLYNGSTFPQKLYMVEGGIIVSKGGTHSGANIDVAAGGIVVTGNGYYTLGNGGTISNTGVITAFAGASDIKWTPVTVTANNQPIASVSGTPVNITAGTLTNHQ